MSAADTIYMPWTKITDPPETTPVQDTKVFTRVSSLKPPDNGKTKMQQEASWLMTLPNVRMKGKGIKAILDVGEKTMMDDYISRSPFFMGTAGMLEKQEAHQKALYSKRYFTNPEFLLSRVNDNQTVRDAEDPNSIDKTFMTDPGLAVFDYDGPPGQQDQVGLVKGANHGYLTRRDRFFVPERNPLLESKKDKLKENIMKARTGRRFKSRRTRGTQTGTTL